MPAPTRREMPQTTWREKPAPSYLKAWARQNWSEASLSERTLMVLDSQVGVEENPSNWGPEVKKYLNAAGVNTPAPWCAALLTWALLEAGADRKKLPENAASTFYWYQWAKENKFLATRWSGAKRGVFGIWNGRDGRGHIFAVTKIIGPFKVETIEGNTNSAGSREGRFVMRRSRTWATLMAYLRFGWIEIPDSLGVGV